MTAPTVFISSTSEDLHDHRQAVKHAAIRARFAVDMMEYFTAGDHPPLDDCLQRVDDADVLVVIVAHRFGWTPGGQRVPVARRKSITWLECERAVKQGLPVFAFVVDGKYEGWPAQRREEYRLAAAALQGQATAELAEEVQRNIGRLNDLKDWLRNTRVCPSFTTPDSLAIAVEGALRSWRQNNWAANRQDRSDGRVSSIVPIPPMTDPTRYLQALGERTAGIDIRGLQVGSGRATTFPIDELYIPLTTTLAEQEHERGDRASRSEEEPTSRAERVSLDRALQNPRLAIVGDPGSGKSTFLQRITSLLCRTLLGDEPEAARRQLGLDPAPLPILIRVGDLTDHMTVAKRREAGPMGAAAPAWLVHHLATTCDEADMGLDEAFFRRRLTAGDAIVLLDGLDEAPSLQDRKRVSELIAQAAAAYPKCPFVVTSRPGAYRGDVMLPGFVEVRIDPLEDDAIRHFLSRWCQALFEGKATLCAEHLSELVRALECRPEIRRMASNPVMLTALAVVHWNEKRLPEQRADLYESIIGWLSRSREARPDRPAGERCVSLLQNLALAMHDHPDGRQAQVSRFVAAEVLAPSLRDVPVDERQSAAERFLAEEEVDSGIVVGRGNEVRFWHLTFQEYLAARALAACSEVDQRSRLFDSAKLYANEWREVVLLLAGVLCGRGPEPVDRMVAAMLQTAAQTPTLADQARCVGLLGAVLRDLAPLNYQVGDDRYPNVLDAVMGVFDGDRSGEVPMDEAITAADVLGQAGDPRFTAEASDENWITIPAGEFWMGAQKSDSGGRNYDPEAEEGRWSERPVHCVHLDEYRISKYPVTVGQYGGFIQAGGYGNQEYWAAGGFEKFENPNKWKDQLAYPTRPVIYVSWYEAAAYAAWRGCRLPTEAEWERAAPGTEARKFPWGAEGPDARRMNYNQNVNRVTPVGVYPGGNTPEGVCDMAGNVWEWCVDRYAGYPREEQRNPRGPAAGSSRVLRGGSWDYDASSCRCASRDYSDPASRSFNIGFRLLY